MKMANSDGHVLNASGISVKNFYSRKNTLVCMVKCDEHQNLVKNVVFIHQKPTINLHGCHAKVDSDFIKSDLLASSGGQ